MGSGTLPSAFYILSDESSIPLYSTSNGYNKGERYSRVPRLLDTRYSAKGTKEMEICKQQSEIEMRNPPAISIYGYVGGRQVCGRGKLWANR